MDNFIFSVNVTIPIFLIILLGYILRRIGFLTDEFVRVANKYVLLSHFRLCCSGILQVPM